MSADVIAFPGREPAVTAAPKRKAAGKGCYERAEFARICRELARRAERADTLNIAPDRWRGIIQTVGCHIGVIDGLLSGKFE
jgi:hypothetical protein